MSVFNIFLWNLVCSFLISCWIFHLLNVVMNFDKQKSYQAKTAIFHIFSYFHPFLQTLTLHNFVNFHWILLKFGMLIPLIAFYFFQFNVITNYQKQKSCLRKIFFFLLSGHFFRFFGGQFAKNENFQKKFFLPFSETKMTP